MWCATWYVIPLLLRYECIIWTVTFFSIEKKVENGLGVRK